jgi:ABC-2 type transport system ATP-binding protein
LPEDTPLYADMTVIGYLRFCAQMRGIGRGDRDARIKQVGSVTGVLDVLGKYVRELSRGYRQRVGLTQAMLHDPPVLILDEPTSGLDPNQIVEIRGLIRRIGAEKTVILSTHILPEVQATCNRVVIINDGKIVADGAPDDLTARESSDAFRLLLATEGGPDADAAIAAVEALDGVASATVTPSETGTRQLAIAGDGGADLRPALFRLAVDNSWPLLELDRTGASLETVFGRLTRTEASS